MTQVPGAEAFVRMLERHGVTHIFGLCGDTSLPLYDALYRIDHGIQHVLARDERSAAYMADGYARCSLTPRTPASRCSSTSFASHCTRSVLRFPSGSPEERGRWARRVQTHIASSVQ